MTLSRSKKLSTAYAHCNREKTSAMHGKPSLVALFAILFPKQKNIVEKLQIVYIVMSIPFYVSNRVAA
jgi:hypothetical protein